MAFDMPVMNLKLELQDSKARSDMSMNMRILSSTADAMGRQMMVS